MFLGMEISKRCTQCLCLIQQLLPPGPHAFYEFEHGIVGAWFDGSWWGLSLCRFLLNWSFRRTAMQLPYEPA